MIAIDEIFKHIEQSGTELYAGTTGRAITVAIDASTFHLDVKEGKLQNRLSVWLKSHQARELGRLLIAHADEIDKAEADWLREQEEFRQKHRSR